MDLSKYNQLEQLSKDQLDELENTLLDVIQDYFTVENIYIIGSFVFGFQKIYDIDVAVMIPESEGYCRLNEDIEDCLLYTSPSPRDRTRSRMPSSA